MSHNPKLSQRIQPHEATPWVIEAIRAIETSGELAQGEIDRLTRELAEAKARAVIPDGFEDGWKDALIAWEICSSIHRAYAKGKDPFFKTRQSDFTKSAKHARAMLSARPELPTKGSDKLNLAIVSARGGKAMPPQFGSGIFSHPNPYEESDHE